MFQGQRLAALETLFEPYYLPFSYFISLINLTCSCPYRWDYITIKNDNNQDFGKYCGRRSGKRIKVTGRYVKISFHSDGSFNRTGYNLSFSAVPLGKFSEHEIR